MNRDEARTSVRQSKVPVTGCSVCLTAPTSGEAEWLPGRGGKGGSASRVLAGPNRDASVRIARSREVDREGHAGLQ